MREASLRIFAGIAAAALLAGVVYGMRAAVAHALYYQAKYGAVREHPEAVVRRCAAADNLYSRNYYACETAAKAAYSAYAGGGRGADRWFPVAGSWCAEGLALNPYRGPLRLLKAFLLAEQSPAEAVDYWSEYVEWNFWVPHNHAILAELQAAAGNFHDAFESLALIRGREPYEAARQAVRDAWRKEMVPGGERDDR